MTMAVTENVSSCSLSAMWDWSHLSLSETPPALPLLDTAADLLVMERNFTGALELCERGLQITTENDQVKASLAVIAIQALAEMERWREVLPWLLQYYRSPQEMPHNIMEICLLLYSRVKQPHVMLELSRDWLRGHVARPSLQYKRVAELHLLNILLPLGHFSEAEELAQDPRVFTKQEQEAALTAVREERRRLEEREEEAKAEKEQRNQERSVSSSGNVQARCLQVARLISGALNSALTWTRRIPLRPVLLALLLLSVILLRLDPASPAARGPIWRLLLLFRQIFTGLFRSH
ncbi:peroxisome assembly protein 26 isoform X3 [Hyla sarda]|nr:peroxisome assembly protein 26 isoform X3 [Hyla sarda]XP_056373914.1 peroxisome assembly protein 26 isoform X3 [Hyla sarda]XP_056373915.1 peroxisome assembly protein 26 isoform X3 [Hyla sarda]XP_056373917.1 peroxisome assembly protein 26 isoform X3 [Hyla sarda]